jgi:hypothetical protein
LARFAVVPVLCLARSPCQPAWILFLFVVVALVYLRLNVLYWFRIPTAGIALAALCLLAASLMYAFAQR